MTSPANPQQEPSMEEILASIRKIISDDHGEPAVAPQPDVLELTQEVKDDGSVVRVAPEPGPARTEAENGGALAMETVVSLKGEARAERQGDFISDVTRHALGRAFESIVDEPSEQPRSPGGPLEAAFREAVQAAFAPALNDWVASSSDEIVEHLKPLIRQWMDDNLPAIIENAVRNEIARAVRNRGR